MCKNTGERREDDFQALQQINETRCVKVLLKFEMGHDCHHTDITTKTLKLVNMCVYMLQLVLHYLYIKCASESIIRMNTFQS
jgi:hypothetical protein